MYFHDLGVGNGFLNLTPKIQATKKKKKGLQKLTMFLLQRTLTRQSTEWEKNICKLCT